MTDSFAATPADNGFRLRGIEMTRTETFTDAAFAFALTLLVISIDAIPSSYDELLLAIQGVPAFGLACALLFVFWHGHWNWSRRYGLEDFPSMGLSFLLVFVMLCYVYPMKYMTSVFTAWITGERLSTGVTIGSFDELFGMFTIYSVGFVALCIAMLLLYWHAWRRRDALELNEVERLTTRSDMLSWCILAAVGSLAVLMGLFAPRSMATMPGWAYLLLPVLMPLHGVTSSRRLRRLAKRPPPSDTAEGD
ncbi:MAG: TMEM175 family protein [Pseudomonadota bacterium]